MTKTRQIIYAVVLNRGFLLFPLVLISLLVGSITADDLRFLLGHMDTHGYQRVIDNESTITILLIGFGAIMDGRKIFSKRLLESKNDPTLEQHSALNATSEYYGFMLIVIGIAIEIVDQITRYLRTFDIDIMAFEAIFSLVFNVIALIVMLKAAYRIAAIDIEAHQL
ncbi:hypothetical protein L1285_03500 [Pseudoalteromonas sp. DL2-H2.2]|uniref:hypothetical protein n=1 Tax=Pseudoalteromonas sp. DL2-H2.2 TaxID=2908889 RepID=UPI001F39B587|nr:hypothetical protein [Pseudoalteromonas sp. DL2-H2.2]MCF2907380.1 hypothetical protein [Pseudoalteromonas sp. DL2-H2.2]